MKQLTAYIHMLVIACMIAIGSCASSGAAQEADEDGYEGSSMARVDNPSLTLADYLKRIPGVIVSGSGNNVSVLIRGVNSFKANTQPLFVVDGVRVGNSYQSVSRFVSMYDVDYIKVLKGSDAAIYGVEGGNGVVLIETKK